MTKLTRLLIVLLAFCLAAAVWCLLGYCILGTIADLATTELGEWPWVQPLDDTQRFRTNLTIVLTMSFAVLLLAFARACDKIGKWGARFIR